MKVVLPNVLPPLRNVLPDTAIVYSETDFSTEYAFPAFLLLHFYPSGCIKTKIMKQNVKIVFDRKGQAEKNGTGKIELYI